MKYIEAVNCLTRLHCHFSDPKAFLGLQLIGSNELITKQRELRTGNLEIFLGLVS